eukprot:1161636-Pelagomonas_calceolata.AAC.10
MSVVLVLSILLATFTARASVTRKLRCWWQDSMEGARHWAASCTVAQQSHCSELCLKTVSTHPGNLMQQGEVSSTSTHRLCNGSPDHIV